MYLMEGDGEAERLDAKFDEKFTRELLISAGISRGMRVLDAGAGSGAVSRLICELVGPFGEVVALERSAERAAFIRELAAREGLTNLTVEEGDINDPPIEPASFDMAWSQFVFEYLPDPHHAARVLCGLVAPRGKLVIADIDGYAMFHHPTPPFVQEGLDRLASGLRPHFDPFVGRKLYHIAKTAGLRDVRVRMHPHHFYPGPADAQELAFWEYKCRAIRPMGARALGGENEYDRWAKAFLDMLCDDARFSYSVLFLVDGVKAGPQ